MSHYLASNGHAAVAFCLYTDEEDQPRSALCLQDQGGQCYA